MNGAEHNFLSVNFGLKLRGGKSLSTTIDSIDFSAGNIFQHPSSIHDAKDNFDPKCLNFIPLRTLVNTSAKVEFVST